MFIPKEEMPDGYGGGSINNPEKKDNGCQTILKQAANALWNSCCCFFCKKQYDKNQERKRRAFEI